MRRNVKSAELHLRRTGVELGKDPAAEAMNMLVK